MNLDPNRVITGLTAMHVLALCVALFISALTVWVYNPSSAWSLVLCLIDLILIGWTAMVALR